MVNQIDVKRMPYTAWNQSLQEIVRKLSIDMLGQEAKSGEHAPAVTINRKHIAPERVHQHATSGLWTNSGQRSEKPLSLLVR